MKSKYEENAEDGFEDHDMIIPETTLINCPFCPGQIVHFVLDI